MAKRRDAVPMEHGMILEAGVGDLADLNHARADVLFVEDEFWRRRRVDTGQALTQETQATTVEVAVVLLDSRFIDPETLQHDIEGLELV